MAMINFGSSVGVEKPMPLGFRLVLAVAGLFCIVMPAYDFWPALSQPSGPSLPAGIILLGAWIVGAVFIFAATHGSYQRWRFHDGVLTIDQKSLFRTWQTTVRRADIATVSVRENQMDGPNTFSVELLLSNGTVFDALGFETAQAAEAFRQQIFSHLENP